MVLHCGLWGCARGSEGEFLAEIVRFSEDDSLPMIVGEILISYAFNRTINNDNFHAC
jgi:hypothetical protein